MLFYCKLSIMAGLFFIFPNKIGRCRFFLKLFKSGFFFRIFCFHLSWHLAEHHEKCFYVGAIRKSEVFSRRCLSDRQPKFKANFLIRYRAKPARVLFCTHHCASDQYLIPLLQFIFLASGIRILGLSLIFNLL